MKAIDRFYIYLEFKKIKHTRFEKDHGLSNGYLGTQLKRKGNLGEDVLNIIIDNCRDINPEWLLNGNGEMLRSDIKKPDSNDNMINDVLKAKNETISSLSQQIDGQKVIIDNQQLTIQNQQATIRNHEITIGILNSQVEKPIQIFKEDFNPSAG